MIPSVAQRPRARIDLLEQFVYFGEAESIELAERYFGAVDETCALLVKQPRIGRSYDSGIPELAGLRRMPVKEFENYLIFYLPHSGGIDVIRAIHGARDIENLFKAERR
jgi:toxin ParE1/3/4